jgi:hypothetical protein
MEKEFVSYTLALRLKALGFDESCFGFYYDDGELKIKEGNISRLGYINAPTFQQAFRWFREEHDLHYQLVPFFSDKESHAVDYYLAIAQHRPPIQVNTFEEAELAALDKLIEIVEPKQQEQ